MNFLQEYLKQHGIDVSGWQDIVGLSPTKISSALGKYYDIEEQDIPSTLFQPIDKGLLKARNIKSFAPAMEAKTSALSSQLAQSLLPSQKGFVSSGDYGRRVGEARDIYGRSAIEDYSGYAKQAGQAESAMTEGAMNWIEQAQKLKGYI